MYGIDAPESKQAFGQKAKQALTTAIATGNRYRDRPWYGYLWPYVRYHLVRWI
ncbi:hypothetical protein ACLB1R_35210 [Escherichia coli]